MDAVCIKTSLRTLAGMTSAALFLSCETAVPTDPLEASNVRMAPWVKDVLRESGVVRLTAENLRDRVESLSFALLARVPTGRDLVVSPERGAEAWLGRRVTVNVSAVSAQRPVNVPPVIVAQEILELALQADDCTSMQEVVLTSDPEALTLYVVKDLVATCQDAVGTQPIPTIRFLKGGVAGAPPVSPTGMRGLDGYAVGTALAPAVSGSQCGDPGSDGLDALETPTEVNHGGAGGAGEPGQGGGSVAPTVFAVLGSTSSDVLFELEGGDGGDGQDGGPGGNGGVGQAGGQASNGMAACCYGTCEPNNCHLQTLVPAGLGGIGGDGGNGGNGGRGGDGGGGGAGGVGGTLVALVETSHFGMFKVESVSGGLGGRGGRGGYGGLGGAGGVGGYGGWDGANCEFLAPLKREDGHSGTAGVSGYSGSSAANGSNGEPGTAMVLPYTPQGGTLTPTPVP